jgi:hypothetical protein
MVVKICPQARATTVYDTLRNLQTFDYGSTSSTTFENLADRILSQMSRSFLLANSAIWLLRVLPLFYFGSLPYRYAIGRKEKPDDISDEDDIHSTNEFDEEPNGTDIDANDDQESSTMRTRSESPGRTPLRSEKYTPQHILPLATQLRLHDTPEKSGSSGSSTSFLHRAHEDAKLASTRNKAALTTADFSMIICEISMRYGAMYGVPHSFHFSCICGSHYYHLLYVFTL